MRKLALLSPFVLALFPYACSPSNPTTVTPNAQGGDDAGASAPLGANSAFAPHCASASAAPAPTDEPETYVPDPGAPPPKPAMCDIAPQNLAAAAKEIFATPLTKANSPTWPKWDRMKKPAYFDLVTKRFALSKSELAALARDGFVVPARLPADSYAMSYHEIYQSELPLFVSIDSILNAIYLSNDSLLQTLEVSRLRGLVDKVLTTAHCALPKFAADYPGETAHDLDLYLTVARTLLTGAPVPSALGVDAEAKVLVDKANAAAKMETVQLFGRARTLDFTQFTPRGHYAGDSDMQGYFRAGMWLGRLEWNLVSRSCRSSQPDPSADPSETPREAVDALALADLVEKAGELPDVGALDQAFALLAGRREDVSLGQLVALRKKAGIDSLKSADAASKLKAVIGNQFHRTTRFHYMPDGTSELPVISTFLGPRIVPDGTALMPLVQPNVPGRENIHAADVAYALGHDRAKAYESAELAKFPALAAGLESARKTLTPPFAGEDLYGAWLTAVQGLSEVQGVLPSFASTDAYRDLRIDSAIAGFGEIRHNYVLIAAQTYFQGGCATPDAYVEPAPKTYAALVDYAARGSAAIKTLDPDDVTHAGEYFQRLGATLRVLQRIQSEELGGHPLSDVEKRWLSYVMEFQAGSTGSPPRHDGWYFDLFRDREEGLKTSTFVADYFTGASVAYVGVDRVDTGIFVVDVGGAPRLMVGPVAHAYEHHGDGGPRLDDAAALKLASKDKPSPWSASYTIAAVAAPDLRVAQAVDEKLGAKVFALDVDTTSDPGKIVFELLDHHRKVIARKVVDIVHGKTRVSFPTPKSPVEGLHMQLGAWNVWLTDDYSMERYLYGAYGTFAEGQ